MLRILPLCCLWILQFKYKESGKAETEKLRLRAGNH